MIAGHQRADRAADCMDHAGTLVTVNRGIGRSEVTVPAMQIGWHIPLATTRTITSSGRGSQSSNFSNAKGAERSRTTAAVMCTYATSVVAVDPFAPLMAFLGLDR